MRSVFAGLLSAALSLFPPATPDHALNTLPIRAPQVIVDAIGSSRKRRDEIEEAGDEGQSQEASPEGLTAHHRDATADRCKWVCPAYVWPSQTFLPIEASEAFRASYPGINRPTMAQNSGVWFGSKRWASSCTST